MKSCPITKLPLLKEDVALLRSLNTPDKIQSYISAIPFNFEPGGPSCMSVAGTLRAGRALCMEGALLAALALWVNGEKPLILDLSAHDDDDHVIALYRRGGRWGALSKSNHAVLRFRDPVYKSIRELVMSYVHEYTNNAGHKSLRSFGGPLDLSKYPIDVWVGGESAWVIANALCDIPHTPLFDEHIHLPLRPLDATEMRALAVREHELPKHKRP
jgi:hypothetical protein